MITAMTFIVILLVAATGLSIEAIRLVIHDGRGPLRPPASHLEDNRFGSPARFG